MSNYNKMKTQKSISDIRKLILALKRKYTSNEGAIGEINHIKSTYLIPIIREQKLTSLSQSKEQWAMSLLSDAQEELSGGFGNLNDRAIMHLKKVIRILQGKYKEVDDGFSIEINTKGLK